MLPRTMSQGNDAFSSKDADSNTDPSTAGSVAERETSEREASGSEPSNTAAAEAGSASRKPPADTKRAKASDDDEGSADGDSDDAESDGDSKQSDGDSEEKARSKSNGPRDKESARGRRRGGSRRNSRDDDDDEDDREPPQTEEALDVPKMQTIYMLGAISILTVILWFAAKLSCNIHPDQMRDPKHFSTRELAANPKNAAFEFHHRFETGDFTTALDLSTGEVKNTVEGKLKACEQEPDTCAKNMAQLAGTIQSTAKVLDRSGDRASVELISESKAWPGRKSFLFEVVKHGDFWLVTSRREVATGSAASPAQVASGAVDAPAEANPEGAPAATAPAAATTATP